jgi:hypothetical protein
LHRLLINKKYLSLKKASIGNGDWPSCHFKPLMLKDRLKIAGKELMKVNVGNAFKSLFPQLQFSESIGSSTYRGNTSSNGFWLFGINGVDRFFSINNASSSLKAFTDCPPVSSIIVQKAQAFVNGKTWVLNSQGKARDKESTSDQATKIRNLLMQPNPYQSGDHFEAQVYINTMIFGYTVILPIKPNGFENYDAQYLFAVPGNMIEIEESDVMFNQSDAKIIKSITLVYKNKRTPLNPEDVLIIRDFSPSFNSIALPDSRLSRLCDPINNVCGAMKSRRVLIENRGPRFVIGANGKDVAGYTSLNPDEKEELENQFKYKYGLMSDQSQAIISGASVNVSTIGFDVKQLGLFEEVESSSSMICIGLGFPKFLAGLSDPTFNNQESAKKALYQDFIIPESSSIYGQWNKWFNTAAYNLNIQKDYSHLPVLQEDKMNLGKARFYLNQALLIEWQNNLITANDWRVANGMDPINGWDVYYDDWVKEGKNFGKQAPVASVDQNQNGNEQGSNN